MRPLLAAILVGASTASAYADNQNDRNSKDLRLQKLPALAPAALVPTCYNSENGAWRIVQPWSTTKSPALACRPPAPWDLLNVPPVESASVACNAGGAFECRDHEFFFELDSIGPQGPQGIQGPQGPKGATGDGGAPGPTGATGPTGPRGPGFTFQGSWDAAIPYKTDDVVVFEGSAFVAVAASANVAPGTDPVAWSIVAAKGDKGDKGDPGLPGERGALGPPGPQGPKGDIGTVGDKGDKGDPGAPGSDGAAGPQGPPGPAGTSGLTAFTVLTAAKTPVTVLNQATDIGLAGVVNVMGPSATVTLSTDGGIQINSLASGQTTVVNILLYLDNVTFLAGHQYIVSNNTGFVGAGNWSFTTSVSGLSVGPHAFRVFAQLVGGMATALIGDGSGSLLRGTLTVTLINKQRAEP